MSKTFCPLPWNFQAIRSNGDMRVCCQSNVAPGRGILKKEDGTSFKAGSDDLKEARNSETVKEVRRKILQGEWSSNCIRCQQEEEAGLTSRRSYEQERWSLSFDDVKDSTHSDGSIDTDEFPPIYYDLRFGNLCNLKCRMCGPADSNSWYEDWVKLMDRTHFKEAIGKVELKKVGNRFVTDVYDWHFSEEFWSQLEKNLSFIEYVYMAGGEPLLIKRHYDFLTKCIEGGYSKNIILEYNTNGTKLPLKVLELWGHFKEVRIGASIDGYGQVLEYQRFPAKWSEVYPNLQKLNGLPSNVMTWLAYTVTVYNVFHMVDFMKWKLQDETLKNINSTKRRPIISPHVAHNPKHLNIRVLPNHLKKQVEDKFSGFINWLGQNNYPEYVIKQGNDISKSVVNYMNAASYHEEFWGEFKSYTSKLDQIRGQDISSVCPELMSADFDKTRHSLENAT